MDDYDSLYEIKIDLEVSLERLRGLNDEYIGETLLHYIDSLEDMINDIEGIRINIAKNGGEYDPY